TRSRPRPFDLAPRRKIFLKYRYLTHVTRLRTPHRPRVTRTCPAESGTILASRAFRPIAVGASADVFVASPRRRDDPTAARLRSRRMYESEKSEEAGDGHARARVQPRQPRLQPGLRDGRRTPGGTDRPRRHAVGPAAEREGRRPVRQPPQARAAAGDHAGAHRAPGRSCAGGRAGGAGADRPVPPEPPR